MWFADKLFQVILSYCYSFFNWKKKKHSFSWTVRKNVRKKKEVTEVDNFECLTFAILKKEAQKLIVAIRYNDSAKVQVEMSFSVLF